MKSDKQLKIASWIVSSIIIAISLFLLAIAIKGLYAGAVPTISKYSNTYIDGIGGILLGISYIGFSISGFFGTLSLLTYMERNNYMSIAKTIFITSIIIMFSGVIFYRFA